MASTLWQPGTLCTQHTHLQAVPWQIIPHVALSSAWHVHLGARTPGEAMQPGLSSQLVIAATDASPQHACMHADVAGAFLLGNPQAPAQLQSCRAVQCAVLACISACATTQAMDQRLLERQLCAHGCTQRAAAGESGMGAAAAQARVVLFRDLCCCVSYDPAVSSTDAARMN